jgi:hypothetical protein
VALNRWLCREVARAGGDAVAVTVAAPAWYRGDLRPIALEPSAGEPYRLEPVPTRFSGVLPHVFLYGRCLRSLLRGPWDVVHVWEEPYILAGGQIASAAPPEAARKLIAVYHMEPGPVAVPKLTVYVARPRRSSGSSNRG